jgi:hypothetical protein
VIKYVGATVVGIAILATTATAEARTCKPVAVGLYSDSKQTDGRVPLGAVATDAIGRQRAITEWRKSVRRTVGVRYAVWSFARAKSAVCRTSRGPAGRSGSQITLECRARALPCSAL